MGTRINLGTARGGTNSAWGHGTPNWEIAEKIRRVTPVILKASVSRRSNAMPNVRYRKLVIESVNRIVNECVLRMASCDDGGVALQPLCGLRTSRFQRRCSDRRWRNFIFRIARNLRVPFFQGPIGRCVTCRCDAANLNENVHLWRPSRSIFGPLSSRTHV
jgi:hypothetical protein